jgi:predicted Zn-dependent protease with MMP-like domain
VDDETFFILIKEALENIPEEFKEKMENVEIVVADYADPATLKDLKIASPMNLLGIYQGVPRTKRGHYGVGMTLPDKITLYKYPILARVRTIPALKWLIQDTVIHEIAHHFGISDPEIERLKRQNRS